MNIVHNYLPFVGFSRINISDPGFVKREGREYICRDVALSGVGGGGELLHIFTLIFCFSLFATFMIRDWGTKPTTVRVKRRQKHGGGGGGTTVSATAYIAGVVTLANLHILNPYSTKLRKKICVKTLTSSII